MRPRQTGLGGSPFAVDANGPGVQPGAVSVQTSPRRLVEPNTNQNGPEPLPQRWAIILIASFVAGAVVLPLAGPLAALGAAGATSLGLNQLMA